MFSLFRQMRRWQLYLTMLLPSSATAITARILATMLWLLGIQDGKSSVEQVTDSGPDIQVRIREIFIFSHRSLLIIS